MSDIALVSELNDCLYDVTIQELGTGSYGVENGAAVSFLNLVLGLETYGEETKTVTKTGKITMNEASAGASGLMRFGHVHQAQRHCYGRNSRQCLV